MATAPHGSSSAPRIVIVGAGLMGTSIAWLLARSGARVTVLERAVPGAEASSVAAGILGAEIECDEPGPHIDLCRASLALFPEWVREVSQASGISVEYDEGGTLVVERDPQGLEALVAKRRFQIDAGLARPLTRDAVRQLEPAVAEDFAGGVLFSPDTRVAPRELLHATHRAAELCGARFVSGIEVEAVVSDSADGRTRVRSVKMRDGSELDADIVVIAAGSWSSEIGGLPLAASAVRPARGQILELKLPEQRIQRVIFGSGVYLVPRRDGRVLIGATLEFVGHRRGVTAGGVQHLLQGALQLMPELAEAEFVGAWSNFRPYSDDHLPLLGTTDTEGLLFASGHYRNGILLAPVTARAIESLVRGTPPPLPLAPYDPRRLRRDG